VKTDAPYWQDVGAREARTPPLPVWHAHSDAVNTAWLAHRLRSDTVDRLLKTDLHDESVGDGLTPLLRTRTRSMVGIDLAASTVANACSRDGHVHGCAADVRVLPFVAEAFDAVVSNSTLDHFDSLDDVSTSLREIGRVLRPGGSLLLTLDNLANPLVALRNALPFGPLNALGIVPYRIGRTCGPRTLARLVRAAGFDVVEVGAILHCPRVLAVAAASLVGRRGSSGARRRLLAGLMRFERMAGWHTRFLTGNFIAVVARRRSATTSGASQGSTTPGASRP
jgi:SAM-dependent methyltransferase